MFVLSGIAVTEGEGKALSTTSEQKISRCIVYSKHLRTSRNVPEQQKTKGQNACVCLVSAKIKVDREIFKCHSEIANP